MEMRLVAGNVSRNLVASAVLALWATVAVGQGTPGGGSATASDGGRQAAMSSAAATQFTVQVGAFRDPGNADRLRRDLAARGFSTYTRTAADNQDETLTLVMIGPFATADEAQDAKTSLESAGTAAIIRSERIAVQETRTSPTAAAARTESASPVGGRVDPRAGERSGNIGQQQTQLFAQAQRDLFDVPPVIERPLGMEEGPRLQVKGFRMTGAVDRPDQDLRVADLEALLADQMRNQPADGYTINQLQAVADQLTRVYRERGFIIARAIVPAQEVTDGIVTLRVLEGFLEDVRVEGNDVYRSGVIEGPFEKLRGYPITQRNIERALLDVQDFPGLTVFGTFTRGDEVGNTDLIVRVREEDRFYFTPSVDNYGTEFTGEYRGMLDFTFNNLFGIADQINAYVLQTVEPENGTYGGLNFDFPFGRNAIGFGASTNQFDVGVDQFFAVLGLEGTVDQANIYWDHSFANGRFFSANSRLGLAVKEATTELLGTVESEDNLTVASLGFDMFRASRAGNGIFLFSFQIDAGIPDALGSMDEDGDGISSRQAPNPKAEQEGEPDLIRAGGDFSKAVFNFQFLRRLGSNNSILLRADGQWTDDILVALEQYAIGGPQNVRAYPVAEQLVDIGFSSTLEWIINAPGFASRPVGSRTWGEIFQVSLFADYAFGETNDPLLTQEPTVDYSGYGLGLQFNVPGRFFARLDVASPIGAREPTNDRDPQFYFRMSYTF